MTSKCTSNLKRLTHSLPQFSDQLLVCAVVWLDNGAGFAVGVGGAPVEEREGGVIGVPQLVVHPPAEFGPLVHQRLIWKELDSSSISR